MTAVCTGSGHQMSRGRPMFPPPADANRKARRTTNRHRIICRIPVARWLAFTFCRQTPVFEARIHAARAETIFICCHRRCLIYLTFCVINWKKMESRTRNTFVLLAIVFAFALQCVSADVSTTVVNPVTPNNSTSGLAPVNPSENPAANHAPVLLSSTENIAKTESTPLTNNNVSQHIVEIEVYYEALCLDSVEFVSNQLLPTFNKLSKFINVIFIPFAQGNITINPEKSAILKCKREFECVADKVHTCGIHKIKDSEQLIKFVNCSLTEGFNSSNKTVPIEACGKYSNIDSAIITEIINCANSTDTDSNLWLQDYMNKSAAAHVTTVPKVVINKNSTEDFASTVPFINAVCKQIPADLQPADCKTVPSGSDALVVGVLPIIIGAFYFIRMI